MKALILVDIQNDFLPGGALAVPQGDQIIPLANQVQRAFELIVATQDWHPANHGSFAVNHPGQNVYDQAELGGLPQTLWPVHCVQGTPGAEFPEALDRSRWARIFQKGIDPEIDSYSGFFDNGHQRSTELGEFLRERRVDEVYVCGLATDYCVAATVLDARELGLKTWLIEDASRGVNVPAGNIERALAAMRAAGARTIRAAEVE